MTSGLRPAHVRACAVVPLLTAAIAFAAGGFRLSAHGAGQVEREKQPAAPRRVLFVDDAFVESMQGVKRVVHRLRQHPENPLIVQDRPWECHPGDFWHPSVCMWSCPVLRDPQTGKFRMWYVGYTDRDEQNRPTSLLMYAQSDDGLKWEKPSLGIVEWKGSKENNIVLAGITDDKGACRYLDTPNIIFRPDEQEPKSRYRLLAAHYTGPDMVEGVWLYRSADGLRWELVKADAIPNAREFNSFFWDARRRRYVGTVRIRRPTTPRHVGYTQSDDFLRWTRAEVILAPKDLNTEHNLPGDDVYGLVSFPYESHYLGFLHTHHADRRLEVQLMASQDGRSWHFAGDGRYVLPNDPPGGYGQGMMSTQSGPPLRVGDRLWVYIGISPCAHRNPKIRESPPQQKRVIGLATLRVDGFVSIDAPDEEGALVTRPLHFPAGRLRINAAVKPGGYVKAVLLDASGSPLDGYRADSCRAFQGDSPSAGLAWEKKATVAAAADQGTRVRFLLKNASLYSFWIERAVDRTE